MALAVSNPRGRKAKAVPGDKREAEARLNERRWRFASTLVLCLLSFLVYWLGLAPTITWEHDGADSGDLATAVAVGGVPHPSGYPIYLALGSLFHRLPLGGDVAYRLNVMSAACAALAVGLLVLAIRQGLQPLVARLRSEQAPSFPEGCRAYSLIEVSVATAALTFAFSSPFWSQAVIAEVYTLSSLFAALLLWLALRVRAGAEGSLKWLWLATGLALGGHLMVLLLLPLIVALAWPVYRRQSFARRVDLLALTAAGLSVYALIPWRAAAHPPLSWGGADDWSGFRWLVTGEAYRGYIFGLPWTYAGSRALASVQIAVRALAWWGVPVTLWGWRTVLRQDRLLALGSLLTVILITGYAAGYNTTDSYLYLLPALILISLWMAWGLLDLLRQIVSYLPARGVVWGLLLLPAAVAALNFPAMSLREDRTALSYAEDTLHQVAPGAIILVDDDRHTFALWYARYALGQRPDVAIVNANLLGYTWYQASLLEAQPGLTVTRNIEDLIQQNIDQHPVYAAGSPPALSSQYVVEAVTKSQPLWRLSIQR